MLGGTPPDQRVKISRRLRVPQPCPARGSPQYSGLWTTTTKWKRFDCSRRLFPKSRTPSHESLCCHDRPRLWASHDRPHLANCRGRTVPLDQRLVGRNHRRGGPPVVLCVARVSAPRAQGG